MGYERPVRRRMDARRALGREWRVSYKFWMFVSFILMFLSISRSKMVAKATFRPGVRATSTQLQRMQRKLSDDVIEDLKLVEKDLPKRQRVERLANVITSRMEEEDLIQLAAELQVRVPPSEDVTNDSIARAVAKMWHRLTKADSDEKIAQENTAVKFEAGDETNVSPDGLPLDEEEFFEQLSLDEKLDSFVETSPREGDLWASDGAYGGAGTATMEKIQKYDAELRSRERALLVGVETWASRKQGGYNLADSLDELGSLSESAGLRVVASASQRLANPDRATYIGEGKLEEVIRMVRQYEVDTVVFDDELSPSQLRNLERAVSRESPGTRICDRTALILDIFDQRASTQEAKLQVRLAQLEYQLPRLTRLWTHLERQAGGMVKGMGEKQKEVDSRIIRKKIGKIKSELETVRAKRLVYRTRRIKQSIPVVALVGYSNAGKSTLLNALSKAGVSAKDNLFETLDPVTRKIKLSHGQEVLLTDTVGFVQRLPPQLVAAFRATLEEIKYADLILHVVDVSSPMALDQWKVTDQILRELGAHEVPTLAICNKVDALLPSFEEGEITEEREGESDSNLSSKIDECLGAFVQENAVDEDVKHEMKIDGIVADPIDSLRGELDSTAKNNVVGISALTGEGLNTMLERIQSMVCRDMHTVEGLIPYSHAHVLNLVRTQGALRTCDYTADGIRIVADVGENLRATLEDCMS